MNRFYIITNRIKDKDLFITEQAAAYRAILALKGKDTQYVSEKH